MKKRTHYNKIFVLLILLAGFLFAGRRQKVLAASADVSFSVDSANVTVGDVVIVWLTISSDSVIGDFEGYVKYNADLLEYTSGASCITGENGYLKIYDMDAEPSEKLRSYSMVFRAVGYGVCTFDVGSTPMVYTYPNGGSMSVSATQLSFRIAASLTASSNAYLNTLRISPGKLSPEFAPDIMEYNVQLPNSVEKLIVSAVPEDTAAGVRIYGNEGLLPGQNEVRILVTAENGEEKEYRIHAVVDEKYEEPIPTPTIAEVVPISKPIAVEVKEAEKFLIASQRYGVVGASEEVTIPDGYRKSEIFLDGHSIPVYQKEGQNEYCLMVLRNDAGVVGLYRFDRVEYTIQRFVQETVTIVDNMSQSQQIGELLAKTKAYEENLNQMSIVVGLLAAALVIIIIVAIRLMMRSRGYSDDELDL